MFLHYQHKVKSINILPKKLPDSYKRDEDSEYLISKGLLLHSEKFTAFNNPLTPVRQTEKLLSGSETRESYQEKRSLHLLIFKKGIRISEEHERERWEIRQPAC